MPTLNVWYARYAQYSQYPTVPECAETTQKPHRQATFVFAVLCSGTTLEKLRPVDSKLKYQVGQTLPMRASHVGLLE